MGKSRLVFEYINQLETSHQSIMLQSDRILKQGCDYQETLIPATCEYGKYLCKTGNREEGLVRLKKAKEKAIENGMKGHENNIASLASQLGLDI